MLLLHELCTNALKHGSVGRNGGTITVTWNVKGTDGSRHLRFEWREKSSDKELPQPKRNGFGLELLTRSLPYDLNGKTALDFEAGGLRFTMDVPASSFAE